MTLFVAEQAVLVGSAEQMDVHVLAGHVLGLTNEGMKQPVEALFRGTTLVRTAGQLFDSFDLESLDVRNHDVDFLAVDQNLVNHVLHQGDGVLSLSSHFESPSHRKSVNFLSCRCFVTAAT